MEKRERSVALSLLVWPPPSTSSRSPPPASESSPHAEALAGLRANEARYFKNKYDHEFTVEPAGDAAATVDWVHGILKDERDLAIASTPLEATAFEADGIRFAYVFYESGLAINVMYGPGEAGRRLQARRTGWTSRRSWRRASSSRGRSRSWPGLSAAATS